MKAKLDSGLIMIVVGAAALGAACLGGVSHASAADATHPYSNVDRSVDAGNNTGDNQTDQLNQQQLNHAAPGYGYNGTAGGGGYEGGGRGGPPGQYGSPAPYDAGQGEGGPPQPQRNYAYYPPYPPYAYPPPPVYVGPFGYPYGWRPWWRSPRYRANFYPYFYP